jgi:2-polyprenyl-3-methyl-5-hydroxy-6-metoxy-1,4-benzoquinol methylase
MSINIKKYFNNHYNSGRISSGRTDEIDIKKKLLRKCISENDISSILDFGCGDINWINKTINCKDYTGIDFSSNIIERNKEINSNWNFIQGNIIDTNINRKKYDLVICYSVLIHSTTYEEYNKIVDRIINKAGKAILISGYPYNTTKRNRITYFHNESILTSIDKRCTFKEIYVIKHDSQYYCYIKLR